MLTMPAIDMVATGRNIAKMRQNAGLTVKINATSTTNVELNKLEGVIKAFQNAKEKLEEIQS